MFSECCGSYLILTVIVDSFYAFIVLYIKRNLRSEVLISLIGGLSLVASGMSLGFPAISLEYLEKEGLSQDDVSWFASILSISQIFGALLCGPLLDAFGRKRTLILTSVPFVIGWLVLCFVPQPAPIGLLLFGRIITGLACGMASIPAAVYIGEMASNRYRGMLVTWPSLGMSTGILVVYLLGWEFREDWRLVSGIAAALPLLLPVLVIFYLKETASWLLLKGRQDEAEKSFRWIRQIEKNGEMPDEIRREFEDLLEDAKRKAKVQVPHLSTISNIMDEKPTFASEERQTIYQKAWRRVLTLRSPEVWKPLVIHNFYFFFMQFGGIQVVSSYAVDVMDSANASMDPYPAAVLLGSVQLAAGIGASFAFSKYGRRLLSVMSGTGMAVTMVALGIYLEVGDGNSDLSWLPLLLILGYIAFANIGFNLIPWGLVGELYPPEVAGLAGGITTCMANLLGFAAIKMYPAFQDLLSEDNATSGGAFFFFGAVSCVGTAFVFLFLPETFEKSPEQIREYFRQPCRLRTLWC